MSKNEKVLLTIPSELEYGSDGVQNMIPPNSVLQFVVELIDF